MMELVNSEIAYPRLTVTLVIRFIALQINIVLYLTGKVMPGNRSMPQTASSPHSSCTSPFFYLISSYLYFNNKVILFCY